QFCSGAASAQQPPNQPAADAPSAPSAPSETQPTPTPDSQFAEPQSATGSSTPGQAAATANSQAPEPVTAATPEPPVGSVDYGDATDAELAQQAGPQRKSFFDSLFSMRLELGTGAPFGSITDEEEKSEVLAVYSDRSTKSASPTHLALQIGFNLELAAVRTQNVKLAFRAGYLFTDILQSATVGGDQYETKSWNGQLLGIHAGLFGPVLYFGKRWYGSFQLLGGPITGTIYPAPIGQQLESISVPSVGLSGWMLRLGPGFGYAFNRLLVGGDLLYSPININLQERVYTNLDRSSTLNVIGVNGYVGLHL
ncbi:MAG TPA: hypothetical protein VIV60_37455, partial [Polyangiaceae bacterium]